MATQPSTRACIDCRKPCRRRQLLLLQDQPSGRVTAQRVDSLWNGTPAHAMDCEFSHSSVNVNSLTVTQMSKDCINVGWTTGKAKNVSRLAYLSRT
jgi:hypothetical protein